MSPVRSISVLMPTWQGVEFLDRVLAALAAQEIDVPWDFRAIDSGSTDGTWELLGSWAERFPAPLARERIHQEEFDHGDTRNLLAARSGGELVVFLTQDAIPTGPRWLATLAGNFADPAVGAAYCRNLARPEASLLTRVFSEHDPGYAAERREVRLPAPEVYAALCPHEKRMLYTFNDVASAIRRELWERHPFPRTSFGEDVLMARALLEAGWTVVYDAEATVEHSHDYGPEECRKRAEIDARFNAEWLDRICIASEEDVGISVERQLALDAKALDAAGLAPAQERAELARARRLREATFRGLYEGGRTARRRGATRMLARTDLSVLYVVHGFPPDTWAGTEVYTLNLAREMQRRGHRVSVLARVPAARSVADGGPPDFSIEETTFEDLRVLRMTHRLEHGSLRASYREPRAEEAFRGVLARERPDLVHFQHLIHLSAGCVHVAADLGLPTIVTCHDYWALCARVQLIRPDGERCPKNMGSGCWLCVKETALEQIPRLERLDRVAGPVLDAVGRGVRHGQALRGKRSHRWEGFADMRARHEYVVGAYARADLRISPSRFLRRKLVETAGFEPHAFVFSDNGMRTDHVAALEKRPDPEGRLRFGFVGSLVWYKGGETLVRAMNRLAGSRAVLNVYGKFEPETDPHHAELARLATAGNVVFKGPFANARLSEVYAEIDVLVVPSVWYENSPITIHEAHLTRTPVVASDIGGMREFVRDGVDGLWFQVGDDADLAAKMRRLLAEPELVARLSTDFPPVKTIAENAAETEFRYRALVCASRARTPVLLDLAGAALLAREGPCEPQGADLLLLRPGAAVEVRLPAAPGGEPLPAEFVLEVLAVGGETGVELGGRVLLDGAELARVEPFRAGERTERRVVRAALELGTEPRTLRLETRLGSDAGAPAAHLRIARLRVAVASAEPVGVPA